MIFKKDEIKFTKLYLIDFLLLKIPFHIVIKVIIKGITEDLAFLKNLNNFYI